MLEWALAHDEADRAATGLALRLASTLMWFWSRRGRLNEGRAWLEKSLARTGHWESPPALAPELAALRADALFSLGTLAWLQDEVQEAERLLGESLACWEGGGAARARGQAYTRVIQVMVAREFGRYEQARAIGAECISALRQSGDRWGLALALNCLASSEVDAGAFDHAESLLQDSAGRFSDLGDEGGLAMARTNQMRLALRQGQYDLARARGDESLSYLRKLGDPQQRALLLSFLGDAARKQGDLARAAAYYQESLADWQSHTNRTLTEDLRRKLAEVQ